MSFARFKSVIFISLFALFFLFKNPLCAQPQTPFKTNFQLLDSLAKRASDSISTLLKSHNISAANFITEPHPALWLLKTHFAENGDFTFNNDSAFKNTRVELFLKDLSVRYFPYADEPDSLIRTAQVIVSGTANSNFSLPEISFKSNDVISRTDLPFIEEAQYPFATAPIPQREISFWEEYAEPLIFVSAAVITLALLFTVRSQ
ncbi:MAG: hypothetical protein V4642_07670 [Bacteroidota bacterium]